MHCFAAPVVLMCSHATIVSCGLSCFDYFQVVAFTYDLSVKKCL